MYAGEQYDSAGVYSGANVTNNPIKMSGLSTEHAAGIIVVGSLLALIAIKRGFFPTSLGRVTGGLVK